HRYTNIYRISGTELVRLSSFGTTCDLPDKQTVPDPVRIFMGGDHPITLMEITFDSFFYSVISINVIGTSQVC
ncbi:TPA: hypothetical protein ACHJZF_005066, partial [Escherichia coli]